MQILLDIIDERRKERPIGLLENSGRSVRWMSLAEAEALKKSLDSALQLAKKKGKE